jgi:hypothetical protein
MGVEAQHEDDEQMVGVPKGLEALLADHFVRTAEVSNRTVLEFWR